MNAEAQTPATVEATPLGSFRISIIGGHANWGDPTFCELLAVKLRDARDAARAYTLRLVVIAGNLGDEVKRWQRQLNEPVRGVTSEPHGEAVGKTLTWGDGEPERTYAVIVLDDGIARGLVRDDPLCALILRHELAHVGFGLLSRRAWGPDTHPDNDDWPGIRRVLARSVLSEFLAENYACQAPNLAPPDGDIAFTVESSSRVLRRIANAVERHHIDRDIGAVWTQALSLGGTLQQIGRQLGRLNAAGDAATLEGFLNQLSALSPEWRDAVVRLGVALSAFSWEAGTADVEEAVEAAFHATGVRPIQDTLGLRVVV
jgi:hypothetical protein